MIEVYFDDSGTGDRKMVSVSGFAARDLNCARMARDWFALTEKHHITHMHTSAFLSGHDDYKKCGNDEERLAILREFMMCARENVELIIGVVLDSSAIARLELQRPKISPLMFCFLRAVRMTVIQARVWGNDNVPFFMTFDDSPAAVACHKAMQQLKRHRKDVREAVSAYSFADDRFIQPLQAADMFACLTTKEWRKPEQERWLSGPFRELLLSPDGDFGTKTDSELWTAADLTLDKFAKATEPF